MSSLNIVNKRDIHILMSYNLPRSYVILSHDIEWGFMGKKLKKYNE